MELLERSAFLNDLHGFLREAAAGEGRHIFVSGEAGIGKTVLVKQFCDEARSVADVIIATCDSLATPGPLAPVIQFAPALGLALDELLETTAPPTVYYQHLYAALRDAPRPVILVGEDAHTSDEASLNLSRFLSPRLGELSAMFIVTYRDDGIDPRHPLRMLLGDLAAAPTMRRLVLPRLSAAAVRAMAAPTTVDAAALHDLIGGNPFFVTEVLAAGSPDLPATVRDAVLARAARLSPAARAVLDAAAVIGKHFDPDLLEAVVGGPTEHVVEECLTVGMLQPFQGGLAFRHGIARTTIQAVMSPVRGRALHRRALTILRRHPSPRRHLARLAHHAEHANDRDAVLTYAPAAARQSSALGAHREAADQYDRALRFADEWPADQRAALFTGQSHEFSRIGQFSAAIAAAQAALALWREHGDRLRVGDSLGWLARLRADAGRAEEAERTGREAIAILQTLPPGAELARAVVNQARFGPPTQSVAEAIAWGERGIALAETLGDMRTLARGLNYLGAAQRFSDAEAGQALLERSLAIARVANDDDEIAVALISLAWAALTRYELPLADRYLVDGIACTATHDGDTSRQSLLALRALLRLYRGDWAEAMDDADAVAAHAMSTRWARSVALTIRGRIEARTGRGGQTALDEALALVSAGERVTEITQVRAARAEAAWLAGDLEHAAAEAIAALGLTRHHGDRWLTGQLMLILARTGDVVAPDEGLPTPFALQLRGDWAAAAADWEARGCPLESGRALTDGDEPALRRARSVFDRLSAQVDALLVTKRLREIGPRDAGLPELAADDAAAGAIRAGRGEEAAPATWATSPAWVHEQATAEAWPIREAASAAAPFGLTPRELDVLRLLVEGRSDKEIGAELSLSHRTVMRHVTGILAKLRVENRTAATSHAMRHRLV